MENLSIHQLLTPLIIFNLLLYNVEKPIRNSQKCVNPSWVMGKESLKVKTQDKQLGIKF